jgi:membrane associated rhomboid family serine protease
MTDTVKQLVILNVIFYIASNTIATAANDLLAIHFPLSSDFNWWQPLTHMFMHAEMPNLMHIFFNMFGLIMFGSALEQFWGWKKFLFFYISCGLGAALIHMGMQYYEFQKILEAAADLQLSDETIHQIINVPFRDGNMYSGQKLAENIKPILEPLGKYNLLNDTNFKALFDASIIANARAVGASGALYGIIVAFAFMFPNAELMLLFLPIPIKAKYFVPVLVLGDLFMGLKGDSIFGGGGIAHFAHVGGAVTGLIMMWIWKKNQFNEKRWD